MGCFLDSLAYMLPLPPFLLCAYMASNFRKELRTNFNLIEEPCSDGVVHTFCGPCALCQEAYELKAQGYGMGMGAGDAYDSDYESKQKTIHADYPKFQAVTTGLFQVDVSKTDHLLAQVSGK